MAGHWHRPWPDAFLHRPQHGKEALTDGGRLTAPPTQNHMTQNIVKLTKKLIKFKTTEDNKKAKTNCLDFIVRYLSKNTSLTIKKIRTTTGNALFVTNKKKNPQLCLNGHIDVVPAKFEDYKPKIKAKKILVAEQLI